MKTNTILIIAIAALALLIIYGRSRSKTPAAVPPVAVPDPVVTDSRQDYQFPSSIGMVAMPKWAVRPISK